MAKTKEIVHHSSGNVFEDLGLPNADELRAKAKVGIVLVRLLRGKKMTQHDLASLLQIGQPKVSALLKLQFSGFSLEKLLLYCTRLQQTVEIVVRPSEPSKRFPLFQVTGFSYRFTSAHGSDQSKPPEEYRDALGLLPTTISVPIPRMHA